MIKRSRKELGKIENKGRIRRIRGEKIKRKKIKGTSRQQKDRGRRR